MPTQSVRVIATLGVLMLTLFPPRLRSQQLERLEPDLERGFKGAMFAGVNRGYAFGDGPQGAVIATEDGGASWRLVLDFPGGDPKGYLVSVAFLNADRFWVLTNRGQLHRTTDGGRTFELLTPRFVDPLTGQVGTACMSLSFRTETEGSVVCRNVLGTADGGNTWTGVPVPPSLGSVRDVWMFDAREGIATTDKQFQGVVRTKNGGKTWTAVPNSPVLQKLSCSRDGFCVGLGSQYGPVFVSPDHGATWQNTQIPLKPDDQDEITTVQGVNSSVVIAAGSDAGHSYVRDVQPYLDAGRPAPAFPPPRALLLKWASSTWTRITHTEPQTFAGVYFVDANNGWFTAYENSIYKTTDGGQTLQFVPDYFRQIAALTPTEPPLPPEPTPTPGP